MQRIVVLISFLLLTCVTLTAQQPKERILISNNPGNSPLIMVDSFAVDFNYLIMDAKNIESIDVLKDTPALERFGEKGKNGVVLIYPKKGISLLRLPALLASFGFPVTQRNLRVSINDIIVKHPNLLLADPSAIESIGTKVLPVTEGFGTREETFIAIIQKKKDL